MIPDTIKEEIRELIGEFKIVSLFNRERGIITLKATPTATDDSRWLDVVIHNYGKPVVVYSLNVVKEL